MNWWVVYYFLFGYKVACLDFIFHKNLFIFWVMGFILFIQFIFSLFLLVFHFLWNISRVGFKSLFLLFRILNCLFSDFLVFPSFMDYLVGYYFAFNRCFFYFLLGFSNFYLQWIYVESFQINNSFSLRLIQFISYFIFWLGHKYSDLVI